MLRLSKSLQNIPITSLRAGGQIGLAIEPIINPHNLKIIGWWCKTASASPHVLLMDNVREFLTTGLAIDDTNDLSNPEDLVRHKQTLETNFKLLDNLVKTKHQKIGKVADYSYNEGMFVQKMYVSRPLRKVFSSDDVVLIDRQQIVEVTDKYILVSGTEIKATEDELAGSPAPAVS